MSLRHDGDNVWDSSERTLDDVSPSLTPTLKLPADVPEGILQEFREAERCIGASCYRAAAGLLRSVLDKTLGENGYRTKDLRNLKQQIDAAAEDGVITASRMRRAHDDIRVLGNDVLHEAWRPLVASDVAPAHEYAQRLLEDFYDDRETTEALLIECGRLPKRAEEGTIGSA